MTKEQVLQELKVFKGIELREEDHTYLYKGEDVGFKSVSYLKAKYKRDVPWDIIREKVANKRNRENPELNITAKDIRDEWELRGKIGRERGTYVHNYCENRFNGICEKEAFPEDPEVINLLDEEQLTLYNEKLEGMIVAADRYIKYINDIGATPVAQEVTVFDFDALTSGTFDMFYLDIFNRLHMVDFKNDKEITTPKSRYNGKSKMWGPMEGYYNCKQVIYSLQQCLYKVMIEKYTNLQIPLDHIHIVHFKDKEFKDWRCLDLVAEARQILDERAKEVFVPEF